MTIPALFYISKAGRKCATLYIGSALNFSLILYSFQRGLAEPEWFSSPVPRIPTPLLHIFGLPNTVLALALFDGGLQLQPQLLGELVEDPLGLVARVHEGTSMADPRPLRLVALLPVVGSYAPLGVVFWLLHWPAVRGYIAFVLADQPEIPCPIAQVSELVREPI